MSLLDKVKASAVNHTPGPKCTTCRKLWSLTPAEVAEYHEAVELIGTELGNGVKITRADIARGLDLRPGTYRVHVENGHSEPR